MKVLLKLFSLSLVFLFFFSCKSKELDLKEAKPNILIIIADDAGWNDVSYNGSEINTPNIDFLAKNGVQLNRFYVNPTCSPSRVSLLTGMPASRIGIVAPISGRSSITIPDSIATLPQLLHLKNYENALFGKWHLGLDLSNGPNAFGFDYSYGFLHGQIDQYTHEYKNGDKSWYRNNEMIDEEGHTTDLITKETINWITQKRNKQKPFYIQLAYSAPHFPLQEESKWKEPYLNTIKNSSRRDFAAAMTHMDFSLGNVLETLKRENLDKNTIVIFISDNGAMESWFPENQYNGEHGPNDVLGSNYPLKEWKASNYEGAIRVPAIVFWKDHLKAEINSNYISIIDLMPTLLSKVDIAIPKHAEGKNIWASLNNLEIKTNNAIYVRGHIQESLILQPYKIIRTRNKDGLNAKYELYDLEKDPQENNNISNEEVLAFDKMKILLEIQFSKDDKKVNKEL
tara:strand:+ start:9153 stop:10517 length:1365 start_codon:yes stop_codon:yes gene_type:complete